MIAIGDATLCTNPLYGRGCSTGYWGAQLLADAIERHDDLRAIALDYDEALRREILPWYRSTVIQDAEARRVAAALLAGEDPDGDDTDPRTMMRAVFRDGLRAGPADRRRRAAGLRPEPQPAERTRRADGRHRRVGPRPRRLGAAPRPSGARPDRARPPARSSSPPRSA